jgi:hypothetical protein
MVYPDAINNLYPVSGSDTLAAGGHSFLHNETTTALEEVRDYLESGLPLVEVPQSGNYTLQIQDAGKVVAIGGTAAASVTVPTNTDEPFAIGSVVYVYNSANIELTLVAAGGVTIRNAGIIPEFGQASLRKRDTNEWVAGGLVTVLQ